MEEDELIIQRDEEIIESQPADEVTEVESERQVLRVTVSGKITTNPLHGLPQRPTLTPAQKAAGDVSNKIPIEITPNTWMMVDPTKDRRIIEENRQRIYQHMTRYDTRANSARSVDFIDDTDGADKSND